MPSDRYATILRGLALLAVVLAAYFAQFLVQQGSLADLFPPRLASSFPALARFARLRTGSLLPAALWIYLVAAILFGLFTPMWRQRPFVAFLSPVDNACALGQRGRLLPLGIAGVFSLISAAMANSADRFDWLVYLLWGAAAGLYLWSAFSITVSRSSPIRSLSARLDLAPLSGWSYLLGILALATFAYTMRWLSAPARIDQLTAEVGLLALNGADRASMANIAHLPRPALAAASMWSQITGDALVGVRMAGLYAGLLLTVAVWLLGAELFGRSAASKQYRNPSQDDALLSKILATAIAAFSIVILYLSRSPVLLEGVAWGSLGLWAMLYGLRTGLLPFVAASALLLSVSAWFGPNGLILACVGFSIWVGVFILGPGRHISMQTRRYGVLPYVFLYWLGGLALLLLPLAGGLLGTRGGLAAYLSLTAALDGARASLFTGIGGGPWLALGMAATDMQGALFAPAIRSGSSLAFGTNLPMMSALIAPLYVLGLGAVILNLDSLTGWTLAGWMTLGAAVSVLFARPLAPHWSSLIVLWPAAALITAFALDRLRAALAVYVGSWTRQAILYFAAGVVAGAAALGWLTFYESAMQSSDTPSAVGRAIREAMASGDSVEIVSEPWTESDLTIVAFLAGTTPEAAAAMRTDVARLPADLPSGTQLVLPATNRSAVGDVLLRYPGGELTVHRDLNANPVAYSYRVGP